jgi:DNA-binding FrmR family transcriptional regulator
MEKADLLRRLRRIEGQVRGLEQMIEDDRYCIDVLTQITSVTAALRGVSMGLLDEHLRHCVLEAAEEGGAEAEAKLAEAGQAVARLMRV